MSQDHLPEEERGRLLSRGCFPWIKGWPVGCCSWPCVATTWVPGAGRGAHTRASEKPQGGNRDETRRRKHHPQHYPHHRAVAAWSWPKPARAVHCSWPGLRGLKLCARDVLGPLRHSALSLSSTGSRLLDSPSNCWLSADPARLSADSLLHRGSVAPA